MIEDLENRRLEYHPEWISTFKPGEYVTFHMIRQTDDKYFEFCKYLACVNEVSTQSTERYTSQDPNWY